MTDSEIVARKYHDLEALSQKPRWGWLQWLVITLLVIIAVGVSIPAFNGTIPKARLMSAASCERMVLISLKSYAGDHKGSYPESATSNDAFRELFKAGLLDDERSFTVASSPYVPDNNIGMAPGFEEALKPGENHWAMTKGLTDESSGNAPLIFENPAVASWPPYWNASLAGAAKPGRAWKNGLIVIARNDGSVGAEKLSDANGERVTLAPIQDGKNIFDFAGPHEIMDVARRPDVH